MDEEVWVTSNRRGEVRVACRCKPKMSEIFRRISRLLHRSQHQERNRLLLGLSADSLQQLLKIPWPGLGRRHSEAVAETRHEFLELLDTERVGLLMDTVEAGRVLLVEVRGD